MSASARSISFLSRVHLSDQLSHSTLTCGISAGIAAQSASMLNVAMRTEEPHKASGACVQHRSAPAISQIKSVPRDQTTATELN